MKLGAVTLSRFVLGSCRGAMLKQRKLDEVLRAGATSRHVNVDKLMASTIHTLINYNIEFTPASTSQNTVQDSSLKYIVLKPENEPTKKQHVINNVQAKKKLRNLAVKWNRKWKIENSLGGKGHACRKTSAGKTTANE